jgi:hypothetical protein
MIEATRHAAGGWCRRSRWRAFVAGVLGAAVASLAVVGSSMPERAGASPMPTPSPTLSAAPDGQHGFPLMSVAEPADLARRGFVEDEVFMEGTARSYVPDAPLGDVTDGRWDSSPTGPAADYRTRLLIRRPRNPARFNGTVIVEWLNASSAFDLDAIFVSGLDEIVREGYAYVGVTAQARGVNFMRDWETGEGARYATLEHPGDSYSYDIFSQAAQAIREPDPADSAPLGDLTGGIDELVAVGNSQSGSRMITYINAVHPTVGLYDGFLPFFSNNGAALSQSPLPQVQPPAGPASRIRTDSDEPVLFINSETEFAGGGRGIHSQPDSEDFRLWELTGVAHAPGLVHLDEVRVAQLASAGIEVTPRDCGPLPVNDIDQYPPFRAGLHAIRKWVRTGRAPLRAPRAEVVIPSDPTQPATIARDPATGIAIGGLRLPDVAVPVRTLSGERSPAAIPPGPACQGFLFGASDPWNGDRDPYDGDATLDISPTPEPSLSELYGNERTYVSRVTRSATELVRRDYLRPRDAREIITEARAVDIP